MTTRPTRAQEQARNRLVDALGAIAEAARIDGRAGLDPAGLIATAGRLAGISPGFPLDQLLARALDTRALALGLAPGTGEMLTLMDAESGLSPAALLLLPDDAFREQVATLERELGEF